MAFDRTADAVGDDRYAGLSAQADDGGDFFRAFRHDHAIGWLRGMDRLIAAMLQAVSIRLARSGAGIVAGGLDQGGGEVCGSRQESGSLVEIRVSMPFIKRRDEFSPHQIGPADAEAAIVMVVHVGFLDRLHGEVGPTPR